MPKVILSTLENKVQHLSEKYTVTLTQTEKNIHEAEGSLSEMIGQLTGSLSDLQGLQELQKLLK
jgi:type I restriction enzyme M protein